jgi:hypothetical protein
MDLDSLKGILILGRFPLHLLGIDHVHRFIRSQVSNQWVPGFESQKGLMYFRPLVWLM